MEAAGLLPNETVLCTNEHNGTQFLTYVTPGRRGRGELILNGPVARQAACGDRLTIHRYDSLSEDQVDAMSSQVLRIDTSAGVSPSAGWVVVPS
jgi:aspartate 1-decarboxylase